MTALVLFRRGIRACSSGLEIVVYHCLDTEYFLFSSYCKGVCARAHVCLCVYLPVNRERLVHVASFQVCVVWNQHTSQETRFCFEDLSSFLGNLQKSRWRVVLVSDVACSEGNSVTGWIAEASSPVTSRLANSLLTPWTWHKGRDYAR